MVSDTTSNPGAEYVRLLALEAAWPWIAADVEHAPGEDAWQTRWMGQGDDIRALVLGVDAVPDMWAVVMTGDDPEVVGQTHLKSRIDLGRSPYIGDHWHVRPDLDGVCCHNVLIAGFHPEPGTETIRFERGGQVQDVETQDDGKRFIFADLNDAAPIERFTGVRIDGVWHDPVREDLPYRAAYAAQAWEAYSHDWDTPKGTWHDWCGSLFFELEGDEFNDMAVALLRELDPEKHGSGLGSLGAGPIYGSGHAFYDLVENDPLIDPRSLYQALLMERPEFLQKDVAERYHRLMTRLRAHTG
ncbi:MAG: hypothetical protein MPJ78_07975 [Hyphomicrobiaceae bacterium]|nr:hypothetical protein [Hyphomicrobiaceae bacterium]